MKSVFFKSMVSIGCLLIVNWLFSQNITLGSRTLEGYENQRWNLGRYVWSHTNFMVNHNYKSALDFDAIENWRGLGYYSISPNGNYFAYSVEKGIWPNIKNDSLIIQSTKNSWREQFYGVLPGFFSENSRQYIYQDRRQLYFLTLGKSKSTVIDSVKSYKTDKQHKWIAFKLTAKNEGLKLQNLASGNKVYFSNVSDYDFDESSKWLAFRIKGTQDLQLYNLEAQTKFSFSSVISYVFDAKGEFIVFIDNKGELSFVDLKSLKVTSLWTPTKVGNQIKDFRLDNGRCQVVFVTEDEHKEISIWYWKQGMEKAVLKVNKEIIDTENLSLQSSAIFTDNGNYIQFLVKPVPETQTQMNDAVQLDIWSYKDTVLQSAQALSKDRKPYTWMPGYNRKPFTAVINLKSGKIVQLENELEILDGLHGDYAIVKTKGSIIYGDRFWEEGYNKDSNWVVSLQDGSRRLLPTFNSGLSVGWFSPGNKYCIYFAPEKGFHYFSYDLQTGNTKDISSNVSSNLLANSNLYILTDKKPEKSNELAAWMKEDQSLLVYDNYDIWQLDPSGKAPAVNLTNGYGRKNNIVFSIIDTRRRFFEELLDGNETLILTAFDRKSKYNGFYKISLNNRLKDPELLSMDPCFMQTSGGIRGLVDNDKSCLTRKAEKVNVWVIVRQTSTDAPNFFTTSDFKSYKRITNLQPQRNYNWMTAELVNFKQLDGTQTQGVLYKPESFDSTVKYPVIISFYDQLSDRRYQFLEPAYLNRPNIFDSPSWLVSHGYFVFIPDIYFRDGAWGPSVINTIGGAVKYLKSLPYVDSSHLGATGHSNSGRFGYYLLTHSNSFAAMSVGGGPTNIISATFRINTIANIGESNLEQTERKALGTGLGMLWENKTSWLDHSALLSADQVSSPLLLFNNRREGAFEAGYASEMILGLRRLEKPVWWLQYDEGEHVLSKLRDLRDFTIRYTQYFDHFLKNAPAPRWMCEGIAFKDKGVESKYELSPSGNCGLTDKPCIICDAWNKQYKRNPAMFQKPISEWKLDNDIQKELDKKETQRYNENVKGEEKRIKENNDKLKGTWREIERRKAEENWIGGGE